MPTQDQSVWVERVLGVSVGGAAPDAGAGALSVMKLGRARVEWIGVRRAAVAGIVQLRDAIDAEFKDDAEQSKQLASALAQLGERIGRLDSTLEDQLDVVLNAAPADRPKPISVARSTLQSFMTYLATDDLLAAIDGNEVMPSLAAVAPMRAALGGIAAALG